MLKRIFYLLTILSMLLCSTASADYTTSRVPGSGNLSNHYHEYTDTDINTWRPDRNSLIYGVGADIVLWESEHPFCESLEMQTRYDFNNSETTLYVVARVNLWKFFNNGRK